MEKRSLWFYINSKGKIDDTITFVNTCNFFGKQELIKISLRKYGLNYNDWIFIGDGVNDISIAKIAPISIGINPAKELREVVHYSFNDFNELLAYKELLHKERLVL